MSDPSRVEEALRRLVAACATGQDVAISKAYRDSGRDRQATERNIAVAVKVGRNKGRRECKAAKQARIEAARKRAQYPIEPVVSQQVASVIRSEARKRAAPWEGFGRRD